MDKETQLGKNRTGMAMAPAQSRKMLEGSPRMTPVGEGGVSAEQLRTQYIKDADLLGTVPPPSTAKGVLKAGVQMLTGNRAQAVLNKLGERLAFERGGVRLYDAVITKRLAMEGSDVAAVVELDQLRHFRNEELKHAEMVREAIEAMGADPTAMTPCADVTGVATLGLMQVVTDPRTSLSQCLDMILIAELTDNEGWDMLIEMMSGSGNSEIATRFAEASSTEMRHLEQVRNWVQQLMMADAKVMQPG